MPWNKRGRSPVKQDIRVVPVPLELAMIRHAFASALLLAALTPQAYGDDIHARARIDAELREAIRLGDYPVLDDGSTPRSRNPAGFPARAALNDKGITRHEVDTERSAAIAQGSYPVFDDGSTPRDRAPQAFPAQAVGPALTRADLDRALALAIQDGDFPVLDDGSRPRDHAPVSYFQHPGSYTTARPQKSSHPAAAGMGTRQPC